MRFAILSFIALLGACAPPGYAYDVGSFTPHRIAQNMPAFSGITPTPKGPDICAHHTSEECLEIVEHETACIKYANFAYMAFSEKQSGLSESVVMKNIVSFAYGPDGQVFIGSEDTAKLLQHVVASAYWGNGLYGKTPKAFHDYAYMTCMKGDPF